ncbi:MAG: hypothetical protein QGD94_10840, partial [Planctomycetia bacterium]|nr:hypothetical protein [Planctomycetia bacterium]
GISLCMLTLSGLTPSVLAHSSTVQQDWWRSSASRFKKQFPKGRVDFLRRDDIVARCLEINSDK